LTISGWDPISKQPYFKIAAVRVAKIADGGGGPAPAPTNTASTPVTTGVVVPPTTGGAEAEAISRIGVSE